MRHYRAFWEERQTWQVREDAPLQELIGVRTVAEEERFSVILWLIFTFLIPGISWSLCSHLTIYAIAPSLIRKLMWFVGILLSISVSWQLIKPLILLTANYLKKIRLFKEIRSWPFLIFLTYCRSILIRPLTWSKSFLKMILFLTGIGCVHAFVLHWLAIEEAKDFVSALGFSTLGTGLLKVRCHLCIEASLPQYIFSWENLRTNLLYIISGIYDD